MGSLENFERMAKQGEDAYYQQDWAKAAQLFLRSLENARRVKNIDRHQALIVMSNLAATHLQLHDYNAVLYWTTLALEQVSGLL